MGNSFINELLNNPVICIFIGIYTLIMALCIAGLFFLPIMSNYECALFGKGNGINHCSRMGALQVILFSGLPPLLLLGITIFLFVRAILLILHKNSSKNKMTNNTAISQSK